MKDITWHVRPWRSSWITLVFLPLQIVVTAYPAQSDLFVVKWVRWIVSWYSKTIRDISTSMLVGSPKLQAYAMKSYPGTKDLNTRDCALEGCELFGFTKRKLDLPPVADCNSHWLDKVNYSIPRPNTRVKRECIEESLNFAEHGVAHTTSVLETDCPSLHRHIARLPPNFPKRCWVMQANRGSSCNAKVGTYKHGTPALTYKGL